MGYYYFEGGKTHFPYELTWLRMLQKLSQLISPLQQTPIFSALKINSVLNTEILNADILIQGEIGLISMG